MRTRMMLLALMVVALAGCGKNTVSRFYPSKPDATWRAAVRAVKTVTGADPAELDRARGRIVTSLVYGDINETQEEGLRVERSVETWYGVIDVKPSGAGTQVSVKIYKGTLAGSPAPGLWPDRQSRGGIGFTVTGDTSWQNKFLDELAAELASNAPK